jgi:hypothetical protein
MLQLIKTSRIEDRSEFAAQVDALLNAAFPDGAPNERSAYYSRHGAPTTSMLLSEGGRAVGADGHWKTLVYHGSMYAELLGRPWPNQAIDLCGTAV